MTRPGSPRRIRRTAGEGRRGGSVLGRLVVTILAILAILVACGARREREHGEHDPGAAPGSALPSSLAAPQDGVHPLFSAREPSDHLRSVGAESVSALVPLTDRIRVPVAERASLEPYLPVLAREAWTELDARWGHGLSRPPTITLYGSAEAFALAVGGKVPDGVQGHLVGGDAGVAMLSPQGGALAWGRTLWHELVHAVCEELSRGRAPRWFVEGLAEHETNEARPFWRRRVAPLLGTQLATGTLRSVRDLEAALVAGPHSDALGALYAHALYAVEHVVERHGREKVRSMLVAWGRGDATDEVLQSHLGTSLDDLDADIREALRARAKAHDPIRYATLLSHAASAMNRGDYATAKRALETAASTDPDRIEAWARLLEVGRSLGDDAATARAIERVAALDPYARDVLGYLLPVLARDGRWQDISDASWALLAIDPSRAEARRWHESARHELGSRRSE